MEFTARGQAILELPTLVLYHSEYLTMHFSNLAILVIRWEYQYRLCEVINMAKLINYQVLYWILLLF